MSEGAAAPLVVGTVSASDGDSGNNSVLVYSLTGAGAENFDIHPETVSAGVRAQRLEHV